MTVLFVTSYYIFMQDPKKILLKYWGYPEFRPLQEDIILSVIEGNDTLALLPTGGGKSICFQVPAMSTKGVCIVITPLIALMKDQVENLKKKNIPAAAIYSGMHSNEIDMVLDNAIYGNLKFLYVSPERLETDLFKERLKRMKVNVLAVDEAHCISQWGYDFRPPYLRISNTRELLKDTPLIALTATATPNVIKDIQEKLNFPVENAFKKSFERKNLAYRVIKSEDKNGNIIRLLQKIKGTGIIYVRNRRKTREVAEFLVKNKISADYYHAGLDTRSRDKKQNDWIREKTRIMVSTNAFGMGIDKPNVRIVIHIDIPDNLEAYFQEAGRVGRDEKEAFAFLIHDESDIINARKNLLSSYPPVEKIKSIYNSLGNYFQLAEGSGKDATFDFDLKEFSEIFRFQPLIVYNSLKFLEKEGYITLNEALQRSSTLYFLFNHEDLYRFQVKTPQFDKFIKLLLRLYSGLFSQYTSINEKEISRSGNIDIEQVRKYLNYLHQQGVADYVPIKTKPQLTYINERLDIKSIIISKENYSERKKAATERLESVINYASSFDKCRSKSLIEYFGEKDAPRCGKCDVCLKINELNVSELEFKNIKEVLKKLISTEGLSLQEIVFEIKDYDENKIIRVIRFLMEQKSIIQDKDQKYKWKKQFKLF